MPEESTTPDLVERWRQMNAATKRGDFDELMRFFAPQAVWDASAAAVFGRFEGSAAIRRFLEDWIGSFEEYEDQFEAQYLGNGVLFAVHALGARPAHGAGRVQERWAFTSTWAGGMILEVTGHTDIDEARGAAERLAEERGPAVSRNAETVRQLRDAFNAFYRGEVSSEAIAEKYDPQIEIIWRDRQTYPDVPQQLEGIPACIAFNEVYRERWVDMVQEPLELIEVPGERVLTLIRQSGRGRQSGVPIVIHFFELCTVRDEKVSKIEFFRHRADALHAVGLAE